MDGQALLRQLEEHQQDGWRLMVINACALVPAAAPAPGAEGGEVEVTWSLEKDGEVKGFKETVPAGGTVPSVCGLFRHAFLYENELQELFGLTVDGLVKDFQGQLYQASEKLPMSPKAIKARLDAMKAQEAAAKAKEAAARGKKP